MLFEVTENAVAVAAFPVVLWFRVATLLAATVPDVIAEPFKLVKDAPLIAGNAPESFDAVSVEILASAIVPDEIFDPLRLVRFAPLIAGSVLGNLPSAIVPVKLLAASEPLNEPAVSKFELGLYQDI